MNMSDQKSDNISPNRFSQFQIFVMWLWHSQYIHKQFNSLLSFKYYTNLTLSVYALYKGLDAKILQNLQQNPIDK